MNNMNAAVLKNEQESAAPLALQDLFAHGQVSPGLYVASGTRDLVQFVSEKVVELLNFEFRHAAADVKQESMLGKLMWVDSGNTFDPYSIARMAVQNRMDPKRVLRAIQVARPFTAFQFHQMLEKIPGGAVWSSGTREPAVQFTPLVIISDLLALFYDPELQEKDRERAIGEFLQGLAILKRKAVVVALMMNHVPPASCRFLPSAVLQLAHHVFETVPLNVVIPPIRGQVSIFHSQTRGVSDNGKWGMKDQFLQVAVG